MQIVKPSIVGNILFVFSNIGSLEKIKFVDEPYTISKNTTADLIIQSLTQVNTDLSTIKYTRKGTPLQIMVWDYLLQIPRGTTLSYGELAQIVGGSALSVGNALRANPLPILFPCHRIVAKSGLGGYSGQTKGKMINIKKKLLQLEGVKLDQITRAY